MQTSPPGSHATDMSRLAHKPDPKHWSSSLTILLGLALVLGFLHWARPVLIPLALAILITFLLSPLVTWLTRHGLGRVPSAIFVTLATLALTLFVGWTISRQVGSLVESYPKYERNINEKIASLRFLGQGGTLDRARDVARRVERQLKRADVDVTPEDIEARRAQMVRVVVDPGPFRMAEFWPMLKPVLAPLAGAALVVMLVFFMLLGREDLRDRFIALVGERQLAQTTRALDDAGSRISRYLVTQLVINAAFGVVVGVGLYLLEVPFAPLWGAIAFALRYVPYLGAWIAMLLPLAMSLLVTRDWSTSLAVLGLFAVAEAITNMIVEPTFYGRGIGVSQPALLAAVAFWTWLWGPVGLLLASPLTVCLVVLGRHVPHLRFFDTLLGDRPALEAPQRFYQRLLARDYDDAAEIAEKSLREKPLVEVYEHLLLPALVEMRQDLHLDRIADASADAMAEGIREIAEDLARIPHSKAVEDSSTPSAPEPAALPARAKVYVIPSRDSIDHAALVMLRAAVGEAALTWISARRAHDSRELIETVGEEKPDLICIVAVPPGGTTHARSLCARLHSQFPGTRIVVARWGSADNQPREREQFAAAGAERMDVAFSETVHVCERLAERHATRDMLEAD